MTLRIRAIATAVAGLATMPIVRAGEVADAFDAEADPVRAVVESSRTR